MNDKINEKESAEWDADFTKLTPSERQRIEVAEMEINNGDYVSHDSIDW